MRGLVDTYSLVINGKFEKRFLIHANHRPLRNRMLTSSL